MAGLALLFRRINSEVKKHSRAASTTVPFITRQTTWLSAGCWTEKHSSTQMGWMVREGDEHPAGPETESEGERETIMMMMIKMRLFCLPPSV